MQNKLNWRLIKQSLLLFIIFIYSCSSNYQKNTSKVLLITGGHSFDTVEFFNLFKSLEPEGYLIDTLSQPFANKLIGSGKADNYDIFVFYDSWQNISEDEKAGYLNLAGKAKGFLFLHHSLVSYQSWDEFSKIRGGRYPKSDPPDTVHDGKYRHDLDLELTIIDTSNPITKGIENFVQHDEGYSNVIFNESITPILKTDNPWCSDYYGWINSYENSRIVYLMGGHDKAAYENPNFIKLISNSLKYLKN